MGVLQRQNTLFVSEDWLRIYEAIQNVEFRAYDFDNLVSAILNHLRNVFPEEFNDWIASSEFIMKVEVLAWLSQNIAFRIDLNTRENFLATAERRESLIRLAQNISYKVSRVRGARGRVRVESIRTNQALFDSNNISLQDREIVWNDPRNEDFFEQFVIVMNAAFTSRTQFGRPLNRVDSAGGVRTDQYVFNGRAPSNGNYTFTADVNGVGLPFGVINSSVNDNGTFTEFPPNPENAYNIFYVTDGRGLSSDGTGFFLQLRQGTMVFQEEEFIEPEVIRIVDIETQNINNDDFFVEELDAEGNVVEVWEQVDTVFGESVSFLPTDQSDFLDEGSDNTGNQNSGDARKVYEIDTLENDRVRVRFGDGSFGEIPVGRFRFWYRTSNPQPQLVTPSDIGRESFTLPYVSNDKIFFLTITVALKTNISNAAASETNFSIRTRANQVYYAQNRMITGRDYNGFFLRDQAIAKVKSVNRTFSGHGRYTRLHDPTGLYDNLKIVAEDGRFYQERVRGVDFVTADTSQLSNARLIQDFIEPELGEADKKQLYFNDYPERFFPVNHFWFEDSVVDNRSRGRIVATQGDAGTAIKVGDATTDDPARFVVTDSFLRLDGPSGSVVRVDRVIDDGDITDGIILEIDVVNDVRVSAVFPPFRTKFTEAEKLAIEQRLEIKVDFGITWNQTNQSWDIILPENLDKQESGGEFCLDFQGDTTEMNLDSSWIIYLEFIPGGTEEDRWRIVDRGIGLFFESARENDFFFANEEPVVDLQTGKVENDRILIMECNEARDSLRRRKVGNINLGRLLECEIFCYEFVGDGTTTKFTTSENPLDPGVIVTVDGKLQINGVDYVIETKVSGDSIVFNSPPANGAEVLICLTTNEALMAVTTKTGNFQGDGVDTQFDLGVEVARVENTFVYWDGVLQRPLSDYNITQLGNGNAAIEFAVAVPAGVHIFVYSLCEINNELFTRTNYLGDDATTSFTVTDGNQTDDSIQVYLDGVYQDISSYSYTTDGADTEIIFPAAVPLNVAIHIVTQKDTAFVRSENYSLGVSDGVTTNYPLTDDINVTGPTTLVFIDGVIQAGPWATTTPVVWTAPGGNNMTFVTAPSAGAVLSAITLAGGVGVNPNAAQGLTGLGDGTSDEDPLAAGNQGNVSVSSLLVQYLGRDVPLFVEDVIRHADGYVNPNGLEVRPADSDNSGFEDDPFIFDRIVLQDGFTDLVLWRKIDQFGFSVWDPINLFTRPRGTYGLSVQGDIQDGTVIDNNTFTSGIPLQVSCSLQQFQFRVQDGDIHYDVTTDTWLVADVIGSMTWQAAADQTLFRFAIGRDHLKFLWLHFAPDAFRIDPSVSNIMDVYLLTAAYDTTYRTALANNTPLDDLPAPPTSESLRIDFADFDDFKAQSDAIIYHPGRYKPLFGQQAIDELKATFKVLQAEGSLLSENDLKLRILDAINIFFGLDNFDFGESFYLTELLAFIHQELAPNIQSIVAVPDLDTQAFGRLFQIRAEPDELFISAASAEDIELVTSFTDEELRIGTLS